jgi:hypothetical protein
MFKARDIRDAREQQGRTADCDGSQVRGVCIAVCGKDKGGAPDEEKRAGCWESTVVPALACGTYCECMYHTDEKI